MFFSRAGGERFIQRIDVPTGDFMVDDFTWDADEHLLDLSSIVPANAIRVRVRIEIYSDTAKNYIGLWAANSTTYHDDVKARVQVANITNMVVADIPLTTPQIIQYRAKIYSGTVPVCAISIYGWWI